MEDAFPLPSIPSFDSSVQFWMIRTKQGFFFDEYIQQNFIAIGWNLIVDANLSVPLPSLQEDALKKAIQNEYQEKRPGVALNKCIKFCRQMKKGDLVMIVDKSCIAFAKIGEYYELTNEACTIETEKAAHSAIESGKPKPIACPYIKRRHIEVIKIIYTDESLNPYLFRAIAVNRHSLSCLNGCAETILSTCYDCFFYRDRLNVTFHVGQRNGINALMLSSFISCSAQLLACGDPSSVSAKTALHSPGDIVLQILHFAKENAPVLLICYMAVFGGKYGNLEFNSIVSIAKEILHRDYATKKRSLELRKLEADVQASEQEALSKKLENLQKLQELQCHHVETLIQPLSEAADDLQITPSDSTLVDFQAYLKQRAGESSQTSSSPSTSD